MVFQQILPTFLVAFLWPVLRLVAASDATVSVVIDGGGSVAPSGGTYENGTRLSFRANPDPGFIFDAWTTAAGVLLSPTTNGPDLEYMVVGDAQIVARFAPTPFNAISRDWMTWLRTIDFDASGQPLSTARGRASITLNRSGTFTGQLHFDHEVFTLLGSADAAGRAELSLARPARKPLRVVLRFGVDPPQDRLRIAVYDGEICALSSVSWADSADLANSYTVSLGIAGEEASKGYATLTRTPQGDFYGIGELENGKAFSFTTRLGTDHTAGGLTLPIHASLGAAGFLSGVIILPDPLPSGTAEIAARWQWIAPSTQPPPPVPAPPPPGAAVFVAPFGSDVNPGTIESPLATLDAALAELGGSGEIIMLPGNYEQASLNLGTAGKVTLQAAPGHTARVFFGERIPGTGFTHHSGNIWKASAQSSVPVQQAENRQWVFEFGTPEGPITINSAQPQQRLLGHRLNHFRLRQALSISDVDTANGRYFFEDGVLYLRTSNGHPPRADQEFRIPSTAPLDSIVHSAGSQCEITVRGVEVYFGTIGANVSGAAWFELHGCKFFGSGASGVLTGSNPVGIEERCEYAANSNDGSSPVNYGTPLSRITVIDPWTHDNGDEGHSLHGQCRGYYFAGLSEANVKGGITPAIGSEAVILGTLTRWNEGGVSSAVNPPVNVFVADWTSIEDYDGLENWTDGQMTVVDSRVVNPTNYCFNAIVSGARIAVFRTEMSGGLGILGAGGAPNVTFNASPFEIQRKTSLQATAVNGTLARFFPPNAGQRIAPFANRSLNGHLIIRSAGTPSLELAESFTIGPDHIVTINGPNPQQLTLEVDPQTGAFSGEFSNAALPGVMKHFNGVIFQAQRSGIGSGAGIEVTLAIPQESLAGSDLVPAFTFREPLATVAGRFGNAVGMSGSRVAVGAGPPGSTIGQAGLAFLYDVKGATPTVPTATISDPSAVPGRKFGASIAISGTRMIVGAPTEGTGQSGAAFIYEVSTGTPALIGALTDPTSANNGSFGSAVAMSGIWLVVGAPADDPGTTVGGRVHVYAILGASPTLMSTILNPSPTAGDRFGAAVSMVGTRTVVGAPQDDSTAKDSGRAYIYNVVGPNPTQPIIALNNPSPTDYDRFGSAVSISGMRVVIGAAGDDTTAIDGGAAYVFDMSGTAPGTPVSTFTRPDAAAGDQFGRAVAISGVRVVVGATGYDAEVPDAGRAYVYELSGVASTTSAKLLSALSPAAFDCFGCAVAADGPNVLVGWPTYEGIIAGSGGVQVFTIGRTIAVPAGGREVTEGGSFDSIVIENGGTLALQAPPFVATAVGVPSVRLTGIGNARRLVIEFVRSKRANKTYFVEFGDTPDNSSFQSAINAPIITRIDEDLEHVFVEDTVSVGDQPLRLGRVRITTP